MALKYIISILLLTLASQVLAKPTVNSIKAEANGKTVIRGKDFGSACKKCEVIADFGGFKYAYPVKAWSDNQIVAHIADIGKSDRARITVKTAKDASQPKPLRIPVQTVPKRKLKRTAKKGSVKDLLLFEHSSTLSVGDKGEERYDVSQPAPACGKSGYVFDSANLVYGSNTRFGEAKFVGLPKQGCSRCQPVKVRWYHEPTGKLHFQVHIYRRVIEGICPAQVRR